MYKGDRENPDHEQYKRHSGKSSEHRERDFDSRRRRSNETRERSRSPQLDRDRMRRKHSEKYRSDSTSSSSSSETREKSHRPTLHHQSRSERKYDKRFERGSAFNYKPPESIFDDEPSFQSSHLIDSHREYSSKIDTSECFDPYQNREFDAGNKSDGRTSIPSGGISMRLTKEQVGTPSPKQMASTSTMPSKISSVFVKPTKLVSTVVSTLPTKSPKIASVFNVDDDDEPEEMPPECKMRMKNVGRDTPTSAGPNSFGKTKIGFCNVTHIAEKKLEGTLGLTSVKKK